MLKHVCCLKRKIKHNNLKKINLLLLKCEAKAKSILNGSDLTGGGVTVLFVFYFFQSNHVSNQFIY
jgi:hypothetical protein